MKTRPCSRIVVVGTLTLLLTAVLVLALRTDQVSLRSDDTSATQPSWQTFTSDPTKSYGGINFSNNGFTFKYPTGWTIAHNNPAAIATLYDASNTVSLAECYKQRGERSVSSNSPTSFYGECGDLNVSINLFPSRYVDEATSERDASFKVNYPGYERVNAPGLDVFAYETNGQASAIDYHVNFPDKKTAIDFSYEDFSGEVTDYQTALPLMIKSIRFIR